MLSDIEISQQNQPDNIVTIAKELGLSENDIELYGKYKAKISYSKLKSISESPKTNGKLILVTALTPTPAGEGKSTVSIGLGDALHKLGKKTVIALREPSLGPCFGVKGGATGGGYSQIVPMEEINLHFTGDIHAITSANNLLSAVIDNHIYQGNELKINPQKISWKRCLDLNDRALRNIEIGLGEKINGIPRPDGFNISVASEIMAILCLSKDLTDLKKRLGDIVVGENFKGQFVYARELKVAGAMAALLKDALKPNLVQTLEKTPALVHGGPFANIAHGCNSIIATQTALKLGDYVVTEAGFGADLGAEKFLDIKCRKAQINPSAIVIVATIRALKMHGGVPKEDLSNENIDALTKGFSNLCVHIENMKKYGAPVVVAINRFSEDTQAEIETLKNLCCQVKTDAILTEGWAKGGNGVKDLAQKVIELCEKETKFKLLYPDNMPLRDKITTIAKQIYRAGRVEFSPESLEKIEQYTKEGYGNLPICVAKTQNSISDDKTLLGAPSGYTFKIRDLSLSAGAGFVVVYAGNILTMPGLPKVPAAEKIDVDENGKISGLF